MKETTFWDTFHSSYQMGPAKHRLYLLKRMKELGVKSFLDTGCGTGPLYELNKNELKYKGTDYSWAMIEQAQEHFPEGDFEVQDARKLTEKDGSWDCAVSMHCLDHLNDHRAAIAELARVSRKYVIIILWRPFVGVDRINDRNMMNKSEGEKPWEDTFLHEYTREDLVTEFEKNGLTIIEELNDERINDPGKYNWMVVLEKHDK